VNGAQRQESASGPLPLNVSFIKGVSRHSCHDSGVTKCRIDRSLRPDLFFGRLPRSGVWRVTRDGCGKHRLERGKDRKGIDGATQTQTPSRAKDFTWI